MKKSLSPETQAKIRDWGARIVKAGLSQREFSQHTGISEAMLSLYISGKSNPNLTTYDTVEVALRNMGV